MALSRPAFEVRDARADEYPQLAALKVRSFRASYLPLIGEAAFGAFLPDASVEWFESRANEGHRVLVAADREHIRGLAVYGPNTLDAPAERELRNVYVEPDMASRGIGLALVEECLSRLRDEGVRAVSLGVFPSNVRAIAFYERCGFIRHKEAAFTKRGVEFADQIMVRKLP